MSIELKPGWWECSDGVRRQVAQVPDGEWVTVGMLKINGQSQAALLSDEGRTCCGFHLTKHLPDCTGWDWQPPRVEKSSGSLGVILGEFADNLCIAMKCEGADQYEMADLIQQLAVDFAVKLSEQRCAGDVGSDDRSSIVIKLDKRFSEMTDRDLENLRRLCDELRANPHPSDSEAEEIIQNAVELLLPDEAIGGLEGGKGAE